ncbi:FlgD immunoglobulin-like domain containing protein [candidate division KSB1 bacterium]
MYHVYNRALVCTWGEGYGAIENSEQMIRDGTWHIHNDTEEYTFPAQYNEWDSQNIVNYGDVDTYGATYMKISGSQNIISEQQRLFSLLKEQCENKNYSESFELFKDIILKYPESNEAIHSFNYLTPTLIGLNKSASSNVLMIEDIKYQLSRDKPYMRIHAMLDRHVLYWYMRDHNYGRFIEKADEIISDSGDSELTDDIRFLKALCYLKNYEDSEKASAIFEELYAKDSELSDLAAMELEKMGIMPIGMKSEEVEMTDVSDNIFLDNYPNPFNPVTSINFSIKEPVNVSIKVYNLLGQEVKTLVNREMPAGAHRVLWDGTNNFGISVAGGIYIYRMVAGQSVISKKMILLK